MSDIESFFMGLVLGIALGGLVAGWSAMRTIDNFYANKEGE